MTKKQEFLLKILTKLTLKNSDGTRLEVIWRVIEAKANRSIDKEAVVVTLAELIGKGKVINLARNLRQGGADGAKVHTSFYRIAF